MDVSLRAAALAVLAAGAMNLALAQNVRPFTTLNEALELDARSVSLPPSTDGLMTVTPCAKCGIKTMRATSSTVYYLRSRQATLAELKSVLAANPDAFLTVRYSVKSGELLSISASVDAAPATGSR